MTLELWALGAIVVYGIGALTGALVGRRRAVAHVTQLELSESEKPLPAATARAIRRDGRRRRLELCPINHKEVTMAPPAETGRG